MDEKERYGSKQLDLSELLAGSIEKKNELDIGSLIGASGKKIEKRHERPSSTVQTSPRVYLAVVLMILASIYLLLISFFPLISNFTISFDSVNFLINLFYFMLGIGTLIGALLLLKKETSMHQMADEIFDSVIYSRLEPVLEDVAGVQVNIEDVEKKLDMMNINIQRLEKKRETAAAAHAIAPVGSEIYNYVKYFILINMTLGTFLFMLQFPFGYTPYAVTIMYIIWWFSITAEYKLWNVESVWVWVFIPTLTLPVLTIIMSGYVRDYELFGLTFLGLIVYVFAYYSWCSYMVKGILPFDLQIAVKDLAEKLKEAAEKQKIAEKSEKRQLSLQFITFNTGMAFMLFSVLLFGFALFGYAIQNSLIPNVTWESIGLPGFVWKSVYSYTLQILGFFLLLIGFGIALRARRYSAR